MSRRRWRAGEAADLGVVTFSHAVQHVYVASLALGYPYVVADLHVSYGTLGVLLGIAGLVGGLLQAVAGAIRRASARLLLTAQNVGLALATLLAAVAPGFVTFGGGRMLGALTSWPQHPVGSAYLTGRFPDRRGLVLSWHTTGGTIGTLAVPLVAEVLIHAYGWRWAFVVFAAVMACGALLVGVGLRDRGLPVPAADDPEPPPPAEDRPRARLRDVLRRRVVIAVLVASTIGAAGRGLGAITTYVPAYLQSDLHLPHLQIGAVVTVILAAGVVGPLVVGQLSDRVGRRWLLVAVYVVGAAALTGFVLVGATVAALAAVGLLVGIFAYAESPLLQSLFSDAIGRADGGDAGGGGEIAARSAFGVYFAIGYGVGSLWLTALGQIIDHFGFAAAFFAMAASFLAAGTAIALAGRTPAR